MTFRSIGKIHTIIAAPRTGLKRKLNWKTFTCGAVLEITPKMISCPSVAKSIGEAICKPIYKTFEVIFIKYSILTICANGNDVANSGKMSKLLINAFINQ